jgi:hypothetical protein
LVPLLIVPGPSSYQLEGLSFVARRRDRKRLASGTREVEVPDLSTSFTHSSDPRKQRDGQCVGLSHVKLFT